MDLERDAGVARLRGGKGHQTQGRNQQPGDSNLQKKQDEQRVNKEEKMMGEMQRTSGKSRVLAEASAVACSLHMQLHTTSILPPNSHRQQLLFSAITPAFEPTKTLPLVYHEQHIEHLPPPTTFSSSVSSIHPPGAARSSEGVSRRFRLHRS